MLDNCPCRKNCPAGCPCTDSDYDCPATTTPLPDMSTISMTTGEPVIKKTLLVLNTYSPVSAPILVDANGRQDTNFEFLYGKDTSVHMSSSVTFQNEFFVFGGTGTYKNQLSKIVGTQLRRVGTLPFDHNYATSANVGDSFVYLCFNNDEADFKKCRMANHPEAEFQQVAHTVYDHRYSRIAASPSKYEKMYLANFYY